MPEDAVFSVGFCTTNCLVRMAAWYDNEWGFSCRMLDMAKLAAAQ